MAEDNRRQFLRGAGALLAVAGASVAAPLTEADKLARIATNTYPLRFIFKTRGTGAKPDPAADAMKKKYGEITMLDLPQFTRDNFPGVRNMDLWSSLFGDFSDASM